MGRKGIKDYTVDEWNSYVRGKLRMFDWFLIVEKDGGETLYGIRYPREGIKCVFRKARASIRKLGVRRQGSLFWDFIFSTTNWRHGRLKFTYDASVKVIGTLGFNTSFRKYFHMAKQFTPLMTDGKLQVPECPLTGRDDVKVYIHEDWEDVFRLFERGKE